MKTKKFIRKIRVPVSAEELFQWHARTGAFERLQPSWEKIEIISRSGGLEKGSRIELRVKVGPFWKRWISEHQDYQKGKFFQDLQIEGPFRYWNHFHRFESDGPSSSFLVDELEYSLPLGSLGWGIAGKRIEKKLDRLFRFRHHITAEDLKAHQGVKPMKILISGASGLIGSALTPFLTTGGHAVSRLVRSQSQAGTNGILWDPASGKIDVNALEGFDALIHLAGENIAAARWSDSQKAKIRDSRIQGTRLIAETISKLTNPPKVFLQASAIGFYGDRGEELLDEKSARGKGFLAETCAAWEEASAPAAQKGIRVVQARIGVVLSPQGGALKKMLLPFKLGAGGILGSGKQYFSWIHINDIVSAIYHALQQDSLKGPVNLVSPNPVTNREFTKTFGRVLFRPTIFPMPAFAARLAFGEMADEALLASARVKPAKLAESNYSFRHPQLEESLQSLLGY